MPENIPLSVRKKIANAVVNMEFNRYPPSVIDQELLEDIASWYKCKTQQMLLSTGASTFARSLLTYYGFSNKGNIIIANPSFTYFERYCRLYNIPYKLWDLDKNFNYDPDSLSKLKKGALVLLASPNNPTGGVISKKDLQVLLQKFKDCLFVVDEAYAEYAGATVLSLINKYNNLIVLRTFSKAFCAAGIRCGALFAHPDIISFLTPLQTPRSLTQFTLISIREILKNAKSSSWFTNQIQKVKQERERLYKRCVSIGNCNYTILPSEANFLLIQCHSPEEHDALISACEQLSISTKDLDKLPRLQGCVRVSIGTPKENDLFYKAFCIAAQK